MGYYTELRFRAMLTPFGASVVRRLYDAYEKRSGVCLPDPWHAVALENLDELALARYSLMGRSSWIPFGGGAEHTFDGGTWAVRTELKDYDGEIKLFLTTVLPLLIDEPVRAEVLGEEDKSPAVWEVTEQGARMLERSEWGG